MYLIVRLNVSLVKVIITQLEHQSPLWSEFFKLTLANTASDFLCYHIILGYIFISIQLFVFLKDQL